MAKKTSVTLPPVSIRNLVHDLQDGNQPVLNKSEKSDVKLDKESDDNLIAENPAKKENGDKKVTSFSDNSTKNENDVKDSKSDENEKAERSYQEAKDNGEDSWDLFVDLARDYRVRQSRLATIYIDEDLKSVLDRLKTANGVKLPTSALLSSIVARFIYDHEDKIKQAIYGKLL